MKRTLLSLISYSLAMSLWAQSGTLPIAHINTNGVEIGRDEYVSGTMQIDGCEYTLSIRGRGNHTWRNFDKKPYKIKLDAKVGLLGMDASKHYALMASADDNLGHLREPVGLEVSRLIGLPWTPTTKPVEVVLNGKYVGLYFLIETVKVDKKRVNITEQEEPTQDVSGGWLVEIDNYDDPAQIKMIEGNGEEMAITYHSPESLSAEQDAYLRQQMSLIDQTLYNVNKHSTDWETLIDKDAAARYYVVQEIMADAESYHGSSYFYKDRGEGAKWTWGPVWDFGYAFMADLDAHITRREYMQHWIGELAQFASFQTKVEEVWRDWLARGGYANLVNYVNNFVATIAQAAVADADRWPDYGHKDMEAKKQKMLDNLDKRVKWLAEQWGGEVNPAPTAKDTVYIDRIVEVHDTVYVDRPVEVHDTVYVDRPVEVHDSIYVDRPVEVHDTIYVDRPVEVHDTIYVDRPVEVHDTIEVTVHDTIYVYEWESTNIRLTDGSSLSLRIMGGTLRLENAPVGETAYLYTESGAMIESKRIDGPVVEFALPYHSLYIIKLGNSTLKVKY